MNELDFIEKPFTSLSKCIKYIQTNFKQNHISITKKDPVSKLESQFNAPKYFYRGENKLYQSTYSLWDRVNQMFRKYNAEEIERVIHEINIQLQEWLKIDSLYSMGYLQHYGFPTQYLDISSNLYTAVFFSSYIDPASPTEEGCICVLDNQIIHKKATIIDLTLHPFTSRPQLQNAYSVYHDSLLDLKSQESITDLGLHWFHYTSSKEEKEKYFKPFKFLPDYTNDRTAGFLYMCLSELPFKVSDFTADYLVNTCNVPAVPIIIDRKTGKLRTINEAKIKYEEIIGRFNLYRILSNQYEDTKNNGGGLNPYL